MIDFSKAYVSHWNVVKVDPDTWVDGEIVTSVASVSVNRDATDSVPLLETATLEMDADILDDFNDGWYRIILNAHQGGLYERHPIATVLFQKTDDTVAYGRATVSLSGASVLKPLEERKNVGTNYRYVPKGTNGAKWVKNLIDEACLSDCVVFGEGFTLNNNIVFSPGVSYLEMVWNVLDTGKWCMMIDGEGTISVLKKPTEPTVTLNQASARNIMPSVKRTLSRENVPNRYYAIDRDGTREVVENHLLSSKLSYENRGRWIDYVDASPNKINGETLYSYVRRRLEEESTLMRSFSYTREYWPNVYPFSMVSASLPWEGLDGDLRVLSQSISCGVGITVDETAGLEIKEWTA